MSSMSWYRITSRRSQEKNQVSQLLFFLVLLLFFVISAFVFILLFSFCIQVSLHLFLPSFVDTYRLLLQLFPSSFVCRREVLLAFVTWWQTLSIAFHFGSWRTTNPRIHGAHLWCSWSLTPHSFWWWAECGCCFRRIIFGKLYLREIEMVECGTAYIYTWCVSIEWEGGRRTSSTPLSVGQIMPNEKGSRASGVGTSFHHVRIGWAVAGLVLQFKTARNDMLRWLPISLRP